MKNPRPMPAVLLVLFAAGLLVTAAAWAGGAQEAPEDRQELVIAIGAQPEALDPIAMASAPAATVSEHITQTLIYLAPDGQLVPSLAASWEPGPDGLSWTLQLREGVVFHDGTPFNAEAVKFNLDRFLSPESEAPFAFLLEEVTSVEAVDEYTVRLHLEQPFAPILAHLSHSFVGMLSPASLQDIPAGEPTDSPVGTGPYRFVRWDRGEQIVMERNDEYWGDLPEIPRVVFRFITEDAARVVALETGEADVIMRAPPTDAERLGAAGEIELEYPTSVRVIYIGFNTAMEPFDDPRVRRAINHAVDKQAIVDTILQGVGTPSDAPVVPAVFGHTSVGPYEYDPQLARQLLEEAGYPDGFSTVLYHPTGRYLLDATVAEAVQGMLQEVGVSVELQTMEWGSYLDFLRQPVEEAQHPMYMLGWGTVTLDADYGLYALLHSSQWPPTGWALSFYENEQVDQLLAQARVVTDRDRRAQLYEEAIGLIWEDAPWLFLHNEGQLNAFRADVEGLIHHPLENVLAWEARFVR